MAPESQLDGADGDAGGAGDVGGGDVLVGVLVDEHDRVVQCAPEATRSRPERRWPMSSAPSGIPLTVRLMAKLMVSSRADGQSTSWVTRMPPRGPRLLIRRWA